MSQTNFRMPKLHECLQKEIHAMTSLAELLSAEETALVNADVAELTRLTPEKSQLILQLSNLENERKTWLEQHGYSPDAKGMQDCVAKASSEITIVDAWTKLLQISTQAKENNRTNGILINRQINRNQGALNILQKNNPASSLYGPNGQATNNTPSGRGFVVG